MKINIVIANDSDILFSSLSNLTSQYGSKIEITNVPKDKIKNFIRQIKPRDQLIILDPNTSIFIYTNILKYLVNRNR